MKNLPAPGLGENRVPVTSHVSYGAFTPYTFQQVPALTIRWPTVILATCAAGCRYTHEKCSNFIGTKTRSVPRGQ